MKRSSPDQQWTTTKEPKSRLRKNTAQHRESASHAKWEAPERAGGTPGYRGGGGGSGKQAAEFPRRGVLLGGVIHDEPQESDLAGDNDSDDSMRVRRTPSKSSSDAETSRKIERLSLDEQTAPASVMAQDQFPAIPPTVSKRSATDDPTDRPRKHGNVSPRGLRAASNVKKSAGGARGRGASGRSGQVRPGVPSPRPQGIANNAQGPFKPLLPRDSGYETAKSLPPSRQNTQLLPEMASVTRESSMSVTTPTASESSPPQPSPTPSNYSGMVLQPASSPLSQQQLASEIKGIYAGLVMVEGKCINIDAAQAQSNTPLGPEQWQALIALHRTLLYEHHDFMMATQHPVATDALKKLAVKYQMPARMWKHAIHAFLEVLRQRRPESHEYMLAFVYLAYQMMALLYETVTDFRDTWIECLGDLARYRMAIEDDKEVQVQWGNVASFWYNLTADSNPGTGRLNHHMGILESPSLRKLFFYVKALTSLHPFQNGHESLATFFRSLLQDGKPKHKGTTVSRTMRFHAQAYSRAEEVELAQTATDALTRLSSEHTAKIREWGVYLVISNVGLLFQYGASTNFLTQTFSNTILASIQKKRPSNEGPQPEGTVTQKPQPLLPGTTSSPLLITEFVYKAFNNIIALGTDRQSVRDILPSVHAILVWFQSLHSLSTTSEDDQGAHTNSLLSDLAGFSWVGLCDCLNTLIRFDTISDDVISYVRDAPEFDLAKVAPACVLPDDYSLSGLIWTQSYCPAEWFPASPDPDLKTAETPDTHRGRVARVQALALFLAFQSEVLNFDEDSNTFTAPAAKNMVLRQLQPAPASIAQNAWRDSAPSPVSHSSATYSATSDSEGWGVVGKKGKSSYAKSASKNKAPSTAFDKMALDG